MVQSPSMIKDQPVSLRRVLVVNGDCLFSSGLKSILSPRMDLTVDVITFTNIQELFQRIASFSPDVVILDELFLAAHFTDLIEGFLSLPRLRVIGLNIHDNRLQIYDKKQVLVHRPEDFYAEV